MSGTLDEHVRGLIENPNMLVPWWFLSAYAYDQLDSPLISDALFDEIAQRLTTEWATIKHPHKKLLDRKLLKSALAARGKWPSIVKSSANRLAKEGIVKTDFQLTIHHTDGSTHVKAMPGETLERVHLAIVKLTLEGYAYMEGEEHHFVSPYGITKVVLKNVGVKTEVKTKTNDKPTAVSTDSKRADTKPKGKSSKK